MRSDCHLSGQVAFPNLRTFHCNSFGIADGYNAAKRHTCNTHNTVQCKCVLDTLNTSKTQEAHTIAHGNPDILAQQHSDIHAECDAQFSKWPCCDQCKQEMSRRKQIGGHTIVYSASSKHHLPVLSARTIHQSTCNHNHREMSLFRSMGTQANCA